MQNCPGCVCTVIEVILRNAQLSVSTRPGNGCMEQVALKETSQGRVSYCCCLLSQMMNVEDQCSFIWLC